MPITNGHDVEPGCYVEGHWGQYGPDHLADQAEGLGWAPDRPTDDPRIIRSFAEAIMDAGSDDIMLWEWHSESANDIERWLNDHTHGTRKGDGADVTWGEVDGAWFLSDGTIVPDDQVQNYVWHWHDGEFFLSPICDDPDNCEDETCAHWE